MFRCNMLVASKHVLAKNHVKLKHGLSLDHLNRWSKLKPPNSKTLAFGYYWSIADVMSTYDNGMDLLYPNDSPHLNIIA